MARNLTLKITKVFRLVSSFTAMPVVSALGPHGLDAEEVARGRRLVEEVQRLSATRRTKVVRSDAWKAVGVWGKAWLPIARASLKKAHPEVFALVFAGIERPNRSELPGAVHVFATRVLALAQSLEPTEQVAWGRLAKRGFDAVTLGSLRDDVMKKPAFHRVDDRAAHREKAIADAWAFYLEWSKIARSLIKDKRVRALMGLQTPKLSAPELASANDASLSSERGDAMGPTRHFRSIGAASCALWLASCAASPGDSTAPTAETVDTSPQPTTSVEAPAPSTSSVATTEPPPTETPPVEATPYPEDAIRRGQNEVSKACTNLVYKSGCDQTRTGKITVRVSLRDDGTVLSAHVGTNDVKNDPKLVEDCLLDHVEKFHFDPPGTNASSFSIKFILGDKC